MKYFAHCKVWKLKTSTNCREILGFIGINNHSILAKVCKERYIVYGLFVDRKLFSARGPKNILIVFVRKHFFPNLLNYDMSQKKSLYELSDYYLWICRGFFGTFFEMWIFFRFEAHGLVFGVCSRFVLGLFWVCSGFVLGFWFVIFG